MQHSWNPFKIENLHVWFLITLMIWIAISQCFKRQQAMPWCWSWKIHLKENTPLCKTVIGVYKFCLGLKNTGVSDIMTSWYGSAFQITGPLRTEFTGHQWIPPHKVPVIQSFDYFFVVSMKMCWIDNRFSGDLKRHDVHVTSSPRRQTGSTEDFGSRSIYLGRVLVITAYRNADFLTWLLIGWRLCCQPIRCQVWKSLLTNMDFNMGIS